MATPLHCGKTTFVATILSGPSSRIEKGLPKILACRVPSPDFGSGRVILPPLSAIPGGQRPTGSAMSTDSTISPYRVCPCVMWKLGMQQHCVRSQESGVTYTGGHTCRGREFRDVLTYNPRAVERRSVSSSCTKRPHPQPVRNHEPSPDPVTAEFTHCTSLAEFARTEAAFGERSHHLQSSATRRW